jgi:hypothetical protein
MGYQPGKATHSPVRSNALQDPPISCGGLHRSGSERSSLVEWNQAASWGMPDPLPVARSVGEEQTKVSRYCPVVSTKLIGRVPALRRIGAVNQREVTAIGVSRDRKNRPPPPRKTGRRAGR